MKKLILTTAFLSLLSNVGYTAELGDPGIFITQDGDGFNAYVEQIENGTNTNSAIVSQAGTWGGYPDLFSADEKMVYIYQDGELNQASVSQLNDSFVNKASIEQINDNNTAIITQQGNEIDSLSYGLKATIQQDGNDYAEIAQFGHGQIATVIQEEGSQYAEVTQSGAITKVTITQSGSEGGNSIKTVQTGSGLITSDNKQIPSTIEVFQYGSTEGADLSSITQVGDAHYAYLMQDGFSNFASITQNMGDSNFASVTQTGDFNSLNLTQSGTGLTFNLSQDGNGNSIVAIQSN